MGILDPLKKLLFGVKGVTKHQAEKAVDFTKEKGEELFDKTSEFVKEAGEKIGKTGAKILEKVDDLWDTTPKPETPFENKPEEPAKQPASEFVEPIRKTMGQAGEKIAEGASNLKEEAKELGGKVVEATDDFWKKAEQFSENITDKAKTKGSELYEKAKTVVEEQARSINQKIDEFIEKEKALEAKEPKGEFGEKPISENKNLTDPLMGKHEDFFDKAKKFLDDQDKKGQKPINVEVKKVEPAPAEEKPLDPKDQKQLNDLLSNSTTPKPDDHIEDADIVDEGPKT
ncbi:MAG TPA: hypothetical protein PKM27_18080 [Saprospiraceae bacterium]|nr:hypothetical protein [Saprospiraceae bacterium]HNT22066.1 hypothetical protein [Saprospiraceae bacterium]